MNVKPLYHGKTVNNVITMKVVAINFNEQISVLNPFRTTWTPEYAAGLELRVDATSEKFLGKKTRDELFKATATLNKLITPAKDDLVTVKKTIEVDFVKNKTRCKELLSTLGYTPGLTVTKMTQLQLVAILTVFKRDLTPEIRTEITANGMPEALLDGIITYATDIYNANSVQEKLKTTTKEATGNMITELNDLYTEIIGICKLAADKLKRDPIKKEMFTYSKILRNLGEPHTSASSETPAKEA